MEKSIYAFHRPSAQTGFDSGPVYSRSFSNGTPFFTSMRKQLPQLACCEETISSNLELWAEVADGTQSGPLDGADTPAEGAADCHTALARQQECVRRWQQLPTLLKPEELALTPN